MEAVGMDFLGDLRGSSHSYCIVENFKYSNRKDNISVAFFLQDWKHQNCGNPVNRNKSKLGVAETACDPKYWLNRSMVNVNGRDVVLLFAKCQENGIITFRLSYFLQILFYWVSYRKYDNSYSAEGDRRQVLIDVKINYLFWFQQALLLNTDYFLKHYATDFY